MTRCPPTCPRCLAGLCHGCNACRGEGGHRIAPRRLPGRWVAVVGARDHGNPAQVERVVDALPAGTVVVSGGALGVDSLAAKRARARGLRVVELLADWNTWGKRAGFLRNSEIVACADEVVALPWPGCTGTWDTVRKARAAGLPTRVVEPVSTLEVWTTQLRRELDDPDTLSIRCAEAIGAGQRLDPAWAAKSPARRVDDLVLHARNLTARGMTLADTQRLAKAQRLPALGAPWAPPWRLVGPAIAERQKAERFGKAALELTAAHLLRPTTATEDATRAELLAKAHAIEDATWKAYLTGEHGFEAVLRQSYRAHGKAWGWLLARRRVVLACTCHRPAWWGRERWDYCHRFVVARALAAFGASYRGELPAASRASEQTGLPFSGRGRC